MTTLEGSVPALREGVMVGDVVRLGGRNVSYVRDAAGRRFFVVGLREAIIMRAIDGRRSAAQISADLEAEWGLRVDEAGWAVVRSRLAALDLLDGAAAAAPPLPAPVPRTVLRGRWVLFDPTALLTTVLRRARALLSAPALALYAATAVLAVAVVAAHGPGLVSSMRSVGGRPSTWLVDLGAFLVLSLLHELGHGLACVRFGGTATEIGIRWRTPFLAFYCRTDDIRVLPGRARRAAVALAGSAVGLLCALALYAAWTATGGRAVHDYLAGPLLIAGAGSLVNLVPFCRLDGYAALNHLLGRGDLQADAHRYLGGVLTPRRRRTVAAEADRSTAVYAWAEVLVLLSVAAAALTLWFRTLRPLLGGPLAASLLGLEVLVVASLAVVVVARRARTRRTAGD